MVSPEFPVGSCTVEVRENNGNTPIASLVVSSVDGAHDNTVNVDLTAGDFLQVFVDGTSAVNSTIVKVTAAYNGVSL